MLHLMKKCIRYEGLKIRYLHDCRMCFGAFIGAYYRLIIGLKKKYIMHGHGPLYGTKNLYTWKPIIQQPPF